MEMYQACSLRLYTVTDIAGKQLSNFLLGILEHRGGLIGGPGADHRTLEVSKIFQKNQ